MSQTVKIRNLVLGEGLPKICVPIVGKEKEEVQEAAKQIMKEQPDLIEWRLDFLDCANDAQKVIEIARSLRSILGDMPLLATFRTIAEGGNLEFAEEDYRKLYEELMRAGLIDAIDVELFLREEMVKHLITEAHIQQIAVIGSNHDFHKTPEKKEMVKRLRRMQSLGMDVAKIAVMPQTKEDLLTLLEVTKIMQEEHPDTPVITMSMSGKGVLSRMTGEIFGSALTFATVGKASAPGQIPIADLRKVMEILHQYS